MPKGSFGALERKIEALESSGAGGAVLRTQKPAVNSPERALEAVLKAEMRAMVQPGPRSFFEAQKGF